MLNGEIKTNFEELKFKTNEILKYLESIPSNPYDFLLEDIMSYAYSSIECIQCIEDYVSSLKYKLLYSCYGGDDVEE